MKKLFAIVLAIVVLTCCLVVPVTAAGYKADELVQLTISTDKLNYEEGESIGVSLTAKNISDIEITNAVLTVDVPSGYTLTNSDTGSLTSATLAAGSSMSMSSSLKSTTATTTTNDGTETAETPTETTEATSTDDTTATTTATVTDDSDIPDTGDTSHPVLFAIILIACIGGGIALTVYVVKTKKGNKAMSILLAICLLFGVGITASTSAYADTTTYTANIAVSTDVTVGGEKVTVRGYIVFTYEAEVENETVEETTDPTEVAEPTATVAPTTEPTAVPTTEPTFVPAADPTATPEPTATVAPTSTPGPTATATPAPTATTAPTNTPEPTATAVPEVTASPVPDDTDEEDPDTDDSGDVTGDEDTDSDSSDIEGDVIGDDETTGDETDAQDDTGTDVEESPDLSTDTQTGDEEDGDSENESFDDDEPEEDENTDEDGADEPGDTSEETGEDKDGEGADSGDSESEDGEGESEKNENEAGIAMVTVTGNVFIEAEETSTNDSGIMLAGLDPYELLIDDATTANVYLVNGFTYFLVNSVEVVDGTFSFEIPALATDSGCSYLLIIENPYYYTSPIAIETSDDNSIESEIALDVYMDQETGITEDDIYGFYGIVYQITEMPGAASVSFSYPDGTYLSQIDLEWAEDDDDLYYLRRVPRLIL